MFNKRVTPLILIAVITVTLTILITSCENLPGKRGSVLFYTFFDRDTITEVIDDFISDNPGVEVNIRGFGGDYMTKFLSSNIEFIEYKSKVQKSAMITYLRDWGNPDVFITDSKTARVMAKMDLLADITDDISDINKGICCWDYIKVEKNIYGIPLIVEPNVLFYNRDIFEASGLDPEKPPLNRSELMQYADAIVDNEKSVAGYGIEFEAKELLPDSILPFYLCEGRNEGLNTEILESRQVNAALEYFTELAIHSRWSDRIELEYDFMDNRLGMLNTRTGFSDVIMNEGRSENFGIAPFPACENESSSTQGNVLVVVARAKSRDLDSAKKLMRYLAHEDILERISDTMRYKYPTTMNSDGQNVITDKFGNATETIAIQIMYIDNLNTDGFRKKLFEVFKASWSKRKNR